MRILCISDTHGKHRELGTLPESDVLIFAGDMMNSGLDAENIVDFVNWFAEQKTQYRIVVAGNHDWWFELAQTSAREVLGDVQRIIYLENSGVRIGGLKFWGSPYTPAFCNWAFNVDKKAELKQLWSTIPPDTNVLITHGPPHGILDTIAPGGKHLGCTELRTVVDKLQPRLHVFGHIHGGYGRVEHPMTTFINASALNEEYRYTNVPQVVEIEVAYERKRKKLAIDGDIWDQAKGYIYHQIAILQRHGCAPLLLKEEMDELIYQAAEYPQRVRNWRPPV